jgi:hypothetical protein
MKLTVSIVIASAAKQSSPVLAEGAPSMTAPLDCFAVLAMTATKAASISCDAGDARHHEGAR